MGEQRPVDPGQSLRQPDRSPSSGTTSRDVPTPGIARSFRDGAERRVVKPQSWHENLANHTPEVQAAARVRWRR